MTNKISIQDLIRRRRSWRSYDEQAVEPEKRDQITRFFNNLKKPFWGNTPRFTLVDVGPPGKGRMPGTYGMIKGAGIFLVGSMERGHRDMEDFGYLFEQIILFATELDLATCWIGVTVARGPLENKIHILPNETIPAVSPLGYPVKRRDLHDTATRASVGAAKRRPWKDLFFNGDFEVPLDEQTAGPYSVPLEMIRLAPSATNKQPWRIVRKNGAFHFFLQRSAGYSKMTRSADLQRIDMGIAMCHFELTAREHSIKGGWAEMNSGDEPLPRKCEYIVSWKED